MPRRSLKSVLVETILFIGLFSIAAHLSVNFWERYMIQNELSNMKSNLHTLREVIYDVGLAYDNLHYELKELTQLAQEPVHERDKNYGQIAVTKAREPQKTKTVFTLGRDAQTNTRFPPKSQGIGTQNYEYTTNVYPNVKNSTSFQQRLRAF